MDLSSLAEFQISHKWEEKVGLTRNKLSWIFWRTFWKCFCRTPCVFKCLNMWVGHKDSGGPLHQWLEKFLCMMHCSHKVLMYGSSEVGRVS